MQRPREAPARLLEFAGVNESPPSVPPESSRTDEQPGAGPSGELPPPLQGDEDLALLHARHSLFEALPEGGGLRSALGAGANRLLAPVLHPIRERQTALNAANARLASASARVMSDAGHRLDLLRDKVIQVREELGDRVTQLREEVHGRAAELRILENAFSAIEPRVLEQVKEEMALVRLALELRMEFDLKEMRRQQLAWHAELTAERQRQVKALEVTRDRMVREIAALAASQHRLLADLRGSAAPGTEEPPGEALPGVGAPAPPDAEAAADYGEEVAFDELNAAFTRSVRGSEEVITERLSIYLPYVRQLAPSPAHPVVELGSGRGEWLRMLAGEEIAARGVDSNPVLVRECQEAGLAVEVGDGLRYLQRLEDASVSAVVAFHVIEHLRLPLVVELFDQARRALVEGGLVIVETPNPENLLVGACNFYADPTHERPIPRVLLEFIATQRGFRDVRVLHLHPNAADRIEAAAEDPVAARLNHVLYGPRDYAVIARK